MQHLVLIADIVSSSRLRDRREVQAKLAGVLTTLNEQNADLESPYTITLGDEFQAVFRAAQLVFADMISIMAALHPVQIRFSYGVGEISTPINRERSIGMDGTAFYRARQGIEELERLRGRLNVIGLQTGADGVIREALFLISHNLKNWNVNQLHILRALHEGHSVEEIAKSLEISDKAVYKSISSKGIRIVRRLATRIFMLIDDELRRP